LVLVRGASLAARARDTLAQDRPETIAEGLSLEQSVVHGSADRVPTGESTSREAVPHVVRLRLRLRVGHPRGRRVVRRRRAVM